MCRIMEQIEIPLTRTECRNCGRIFWTDDEIALCSICVPETEFSINQIKTIWDMIRCGFFSFESAVNVAQTIYFTEPKDGIEYRVCGMPGHGHSIPVNYQTCYDKGAYTWEGKYSWL